MTLWSLLRREVPPEVNAVATLVVILSIVLIVAGMWLSRGVDAIRQLRNA